MISEKPNKTRKIQHRPNYFLRFSATGPGFESPYRYHHHTSLSHAGLAYTARPFSRTRAQAKAAIAVS